MVVLAWAQYETDLFLTKPPGKGEKNGCPRKNYSTQTCKDIGAQDSAELRRVAKYMIMVN